MNEVITREDIQKILLEKCTYKFNDREFGFVLDYFYYLYNLNLIDSSITLESLIEKINISFGRIIFFDNEHEFNKTHGYEFRGVTCFNDETKKFDIYVRQNPELEELYFYHEFTHFLQYYFVNDIKVCGVEVLLPGDSVSRGRIFNEANTQYIAERIYNQKYGIEPKVKVYEGEEVRMLPGVKVASNLVGYQMYDYITKLMLDVSGWSQEEFARQSFVQGKSVVELLERDYNAVIERLKSTEGWNMKNTLLNLPFDKLVMFSLESIFMVDNTLYTNPVDGPKLRAGAALNWQDRNMAMDRKAQNFLFVSLIKNFYIILEKKKVLVDNNGFGLK